MPCGKRGENAKENADPLITHPLKPENPQQIVKQSLSRVHKLPKRKFFLLQQRRKTEGVEKLSQYNSDSIQASVIATKKGETTRQSRDLISSSIPIENRKSHKILTDDTRSEGALLDEILDRSG